MRLNEVAAAVHKRMCEDDRFGYSWEERWGAKSETWAIGGKKYKVRVGEYDCSSSAITSWATALQGTKYEGALNGAVTTHNMRSVFVGSGLFEWKPMSFLAEPGDLYLKEQSHVAMCQTQVPDVLSEFSWGDNGAYGNRRGDQSGGEASVHGYYDYDGGWDGILHYNGKAEPKVATKAKNATQKKQLFGIDVSSNQPASIVRDVANDFALVKLTGNPQEYSWDYVNPLAKQQAADAVKKHGLLGLYHFTWGKQAKQEAEFFVEQVKKLGYMGKAMLVIDYEAQALGMGRAWVGQLAKRVEELAGYKPVIYASGGVIVNQDLGSLGYPIWCANYSKSYAAIYGYDTSGCTLYYKGAILWQYTSQGYLDGYSGPLDCNVFFGSASDFKALMGPQEAAERPKTEKADPKPKETEKKPSAAFWLSTDKTGKTWHTKNYKCGKGFPLRYIAVKGMGKYRVFTRKHGWLPWVTKCDRADLKDGCAGDGSEILGIEIPSKHAKYAVHVATGKWYAYMIGSEDTAGSTDHFAGDLANAIDGFKLTVV